jgi:hypothetical protein
MTQRTFGYLFIGYVSVALACFSIKTMREHQVQSASAVQLEAKKKTWYYVCTHEGCKAKGETHRYEENIPHEHKCPTCNNRMTVKYD